MSLLPKQNFEHWLVFKLRPEVNEVQPLLRGTVYMIAGTQRMPTKENDFITVYMPFLDAFTTINASEIYFTIHNIKPKTQ